MTDAPLPSSAKAAGPQTRTRTSCSTMSLKVRGVEGGEREVVGEAVCGDPGVVLRAGSAAAGGAALTHDRPAGEFAVGDEGDAGLRCDQFAGESRGQALFDGERGDVGVEDDPSHVRRC